MLSSYTEPVLVDFYAVWCGPCQLMSSELSSLSTKLQGTLKVAKVDTDVYPQLGERYQIDGLPTCVLFKGGKEVKRLVGVMKTDEIEGHIKEFL
jgi:thioredoxin